MGAFELTIDNEMLLWLRSISITHNDMEPVYHGFFPVEDVHSCFDVPLDPMAYRGKQACPICNRPSHQLHWMRYSSPADSWARGGGVLGALSVCTKCYIQVQFLAEQH